MRTRTNMNDDWLLHYGELKARPHEISRKAYSLGGLTASLPEEKQKRLPISPGGSHFLRLIAQGDEERGLRNLCGTDLDSEMDDTWRKIDLPHDWKMDLPYENDGETLMSGSKQDGVAYYRKRFGIDRKLEGKKLILRFEGVMRMSDVWLNGAYLGHANSGYTGFDFDVSGMVYFDDEGQNTLLVRTDTTRGSEGWWYEGAGIYRHVFLDAVPLVHFEEDDLYVYTKELCDKGALLGYEFSVANDTGRDVSTSVCLDVAGVRKNFNVFLKKHSIERFEGEVILPDARLWSPEHPHLYQAGLSMEEDEIVKSFGVRTFGYDRDGFMLNGRRYVLHGVCEHQDFAGMGVALNRDIVDFKVRTMKDMGVNAWRSAHHFASGDLLDACDRMGIILIDENRLPEASPWRLDDFRRMLKRCRMNASVAFWSLGNEELTGNTAFGRRSALKFAEIVRELDREHLIVSAELLSPEGFVDDDYLKSFDVLGINYPEAGVMGDGAELIRKNHPDIAMMSTENASYFSTRGIYMDDGEKCFCNNFGSMYSMVLPGRRKPSDPGVGGTARPEKVMEYLEGHEYMGGVFLWTAFDYFGEPSPFGWPGISSQFGIADLCGIPKDYYYYYKAHWVDEAFIHVMPHWNREGLEIDEDGKTRVRVFSNQKSAELFINGRSFGRKNLADCSAEWNVEYVSGGIEVRAYDDEGRKTASDVQNTAGSRAGFVLRKVFSGRTTDLVMIESVDENGTVIPTDDVRVSIEVSGAEVVGLGNGNPSDISKRSLDEVSLFCGRALAMVKRTENSAYKIHAEESISVK